VLRDKATAAPSGLRASSAKTESSSVSAAEHIELAAWRAAAAATDVPGLAWTLGAQLAGRTRAAALFVRQLRTDPSRLETVGVIPLANPPSPLPLRTVLGGRVTKKLLALSLSGGIEKLEPGSEGSWLEGVVPEGLEVPCLVGLLTGPQGPVGVAVLVASPRSSVPPEDELLLRSLMGPLSFALSRDRLAHPVERQGEPEGRRQASRHFDAASIVGADTGLKDVMERVGLVASTDAPVLVLGETGSGKEVIARAVHAGSRRRHGPVMRVNCGAIPTDLVDSELFGHERGSFTGALNDRKGWFERADGGTLFLDEVAELSLGAQVRLLRILQDGTYEKVGGNRTQTADVRIVAATHRDLAVLVAEGSFREDLYYRINVFPIRLPALRERRSDIVALATHFAQKACRRLGMAPLSVSQDDAAGLLAHDWPGNVRELAAVVERAAILGGGERLDLRRALEGVTAAVTAEAAPAPGRLVRAGEPSPAPATLDEVTTKHLEAVLKQTRGQIEGAAGAAKVLGINPHTLRARMRKLGVEWKRFRPA
jgi:transcriptional regulator with GAF, ATPase, and Fis domain